MKKIITNTCYRYVTRSRELSTTSGSLFLTVQRALAVIASLLLTTYLFPEQTVVNDSDEFDFIIVGGGTAGSVIADRLSESPKFKVLVIEAGDDPPVETLVPSLFSPLPGTKYDWNYTSLRNPVPEELYSRLRTKTLTMTAGRVLGGGSSLNHMLYSRGCKTDYDFWAQADNDSSWNYEGMHPYFIKSEKLQSNDILNSDYKEYHGVDGFLGVTRGDAEGLEKYLVAFEELGHDILLDINGENKLGYTIPLLTIADGMRQTTAYTNLGVNKHRPNLHVLKKTLVTEILIDNKNIAVGVKAQTEESKLITIKARKEVILSAGALNTPKLLLLSGIGPKDHLQSLNIKVRSHLAAGLVYRDHIAVTFAIKMEKSHTQPPPRDPYKFPLPIFTGYIALDKSATCPDYQVVNYVVSNNPEELYKFFSLYDEDIAQIFRAAGEGHNVLLGKLILLHPQSRGNVELRSTNPMDPPLLRSHTFMHATDLDNLASYLEDYLKVLETAYFKEVNAEFVDPKLEECKDYAEFGTSGYWKCYVYYMVTTSYDFMGTSRMGTSRGGVVDHRLRVRNVQRLRVGDASVIPYPTSGNIVAPVIAIAEKLSDMIKNAHHGRYTTIINEMTDTNTWYAFFRSFFGFE